MRKSYKLKLNTEKTEISEGLNRIARVYRKFYNLGICYQSEIIRGTYDKDNEYIFNPEVRIPSKSQVVEYALKIHLLTPSAKGVDSSIIEAAACSSYKSFMNSYKKFRQIPKFMPRNSFTYTFRALSIELSGDIIKLPKMEGIKIYRNGEFPLNNCSICTNATFEYDGKHWWVSLSNLNTCVPKLSPSKIVTLGFSNKGNLLINGIKTDEDVFLSTSFRDVLGRYEHFKSDFKRKAKANLKLLASGKAISPYSKNMLEISQKLFQTKDRLDQMKFHSFGRVAGIIRNLSPSELHVPSEKTLKKLRSLSSFPLKGEETTEILKEITRRLKLSNLKIIKI